MRRIQARHLRLSIAILTLVLAALTAGTWAIQKYTIEYLLHRDAVSSGHDWATYLAQNVGDLEGIAAGEAPSDASMAFFTRVQRVGRVFRYKIFDPDGRLRLVSDELSAIGTDRQNLTEHNAAAARAIAEGRPLVIAKSGKPPNRPPYFAEAYVPVIVGGRTLAIVEAYVDQTEKRELFNTVLSVAALSLSLLMALAFAVPAVAWYWRTRENQRADAQIQFLARHDALTGLANRAHLGERLRGALSQAAEHGGRVALHHVNIDRFKDVNDTLGHAAGDQIIATVAQRLGRFAGEHDIVARVGGDEFVLVQTGLAERTAAEQRAAEVTRAVREPIAADGHEVTVTASIGVALAPEDGTSVARLMKSADLALDHCKTEGRDCVRFFSADLDAELHGRLAIEKAVRDGVAHNRFELHFQPLFDLPHRSIAGFEALLRLRGPGGPIPPATFIPVAEEMGLIGRIGAWALEEACRVAMAWPETMRVAVNLSPAQFAAGGVHETVARALAATGLAAHRLELEITESLLLGDTEAVLAELNALKALGVAIAMDDFGTGYSSLSYLWRFGFDKIKIDRAFMAGYDAGDRNVEQVIRTIVALGRSLDLRITVEGVETERQLRFIEALRCDQAQGFFLGRPIPAVEVAAQLLGEFHKVLPFAGRGAPRKGSVVGP